MLISIKCIYALQSAVYMNDNYLCAILYSKLTFELIAELKLF